MLFVSYYREILIEQTEACKKLFSLFNSINVAI